MGKNRLTREEKLAILTARIKTARQKISKLEGMGKKKQRRQRARQLIEVAAYFFGDHYQQLHGSIKAQSQVAIELKQQLEEWQKKHF